MERNHAEKHGIDCRQASIPQLRDAIANRTPIRGLQAVITHTGAHMDEMTACCLIMHTPEGNRLFPGIVGCGFYTEKQIAPWCGENGFYRSLQKGCLIIGTGEGHFDEHDDRDAKKSAAHLVAAHLELRKTKEGRMTYSAILNYVNYEDRNGNKLAEQCNVEYAKAIRPALIADNIKKGWKVIWAEKNEDLRRQKESELCGMAFMFIRNEIEAQKLFVRGVNAYGRKQPELIELPNFNSPSDTKKSVIAVVRSDDDNMVSAARFVLSANQSIRLRAVVALNSKGQFYVSPMNGITLAATVQELRKLLADRKKVQVEGMDLSADGKIKGIKELYYHKDADAIHNGSFSQPDTDGLIGTYFRENELLDTICNSLAYKPMERPKETTYQKYRK